MDDKKQLKPVLSADIAQSKRCFTRNCSVSRFTLIIIISWIDRWMNMWDTVKGPPHDLEEKIPFTPYSGFTTGTLVFTHYTSARRNHDNIIEKVTKMDIKK